MSCDLLCGTENQCHDFNVMRFWRMSWHLSLVGRGLAYNEQFIHYQILHIVMGLLKVRPHVWTTCCTTIRHIRGAVGRIYLVVHLMWEVLGREDRQNFSEFSQGHTTHGSNTTLTASNRSTPYHLGSRNWPPHQDWCHRRPLESMVCRQGAEPSALTPVAGVVGIRKEVTCDVAAPLVDQHRGTCLISWGHIGQHLSHGTWFSSCLHGFPLISMQAFYASARYTPGRCLWWAPGHQHGEAPWAHQCETLAKVFIAPEWPAMGWGQSSNAYRLLCKFVIVATIIQILWPFVTFWTAFWAFCN